MRKENKHYGIKLILLVLVAFAIYVAFWDIQVPVQHQEKVISNDVLKN